MSLVTVFNAAAQKEAIAEGFYGRLASASMRARGSRAHWDLNGSGMKETWR